MRTKPLTWPSTLLRTGAACFLFLFLLGRANASPITVTVPSGSTGQLNYVIVFVDVTIGSSTTGQWFETPYQVDTTTPPQITVTDTSASSVTLSNVGYQLSPTYIPLDNLNFGTDPPSSFTPMPSPYDTTLNSGSPSVTQGNSETGSPVTLETTPLPAALPLFAGGFGVMGLLGWRRKQKARAAA